jgi:hypothetical protein
VGSKNKLKRFRENETFSNVIQPTRKEVIDGFSLKGIWHTHFNNNNPIILDIRSLSHFNSISIFASSFSISPFVATLLSILEITLVIASACSSCIPTDTNFYCLMGVY